MSELVLKGFIGSHKPTLGYFTPGSVIEEAFLSALESLIELTPLVRVRFDLDGDGIFEHVEHAELDMVGNLNRSIEYDTNKPRFSSCQITIRNNDGRWSDHNPKALTYFNPTSPTRYHYRKCIVELGFDNLRKWDDAEWFPLFVGYIQAKTESAQDRTVTLNLLDEWTYLFRNQIAYDVSVFDLYPAAESTPQYYIEEQVNIGSFWGKHSFLPFEYAQKDKQVMLPLAMLSLSDPDTPYKALEGRFAATNREYIYSKMIAANKENIEVYVWGWNKDWVGMGGKAQWLKYPKDAWGYTASPEIFGYGISFIVGDVTATLGLKTIDGTDVTVSWSGIFSTSNKDADIKLAMSGDFLTSNPSEILYRQLRLIPDIATSAYDASNTNPDSWIDADVDYEDEAYYSFDVSKTYLESLECHMCVHATGTQTMQTLIEDICEYSRGSFFIDKGKEVIATLPVRRLHFVIHQPRKQQTFKVLNETRTRENELSRDVMEIKNNIVINSYGWTSVSRYADIVGYVSTDLNSVGVYGKRNLEVKGRPGNLSFLYNSELYAQFLADHYLYLFAEPPIMMSLDTDLLGYIWDLKSLIALREESNLQIRDTDLTGLFEVYGFSFNTGKFRVKLSGKWAGYLLAPEGDVDKRWSFCEEAECSDTTAVGELDYFIW